jgi:hypothetical protein
LLRVSKCFYWVFPPLPCMLSYAAKRVVRGRDVFIPLFLSVFLAVAFFSGVLQGADTVGAAMLERVLGISEVDVVSTAEGRNFTQLAVDEVVGRIRGIEGVRSVDHIIRVEAELNASEAEATPLTVIAVRGNSSLLGRMEGIGSLEAGKAYVEGGSVEASRFRIGENITLKISTWVPYSIVAGFEPRFCNLTIGGSLRLDEDLFSVATGRFPLLIRSVMLGAGPERRPQYRILVISEETLLEFLDSIYSEGRLPTRVMRADLIIGLDRSRLIDPWSLEASERSVKQVFERINSAGAQYMYVPINYLGQTLEAVRANSSGLRVSTLLVALPVFFASWYLGAAVSDVAMDMRRREVALLMTRGMNRRQVFEVLLLEAILTGFSAGLSGLFMGWILTLTVLPSPGFGLPPPPSPATFAISLILSTTLSILSVYGPARRAMRMSVVDSLRGLGTSEGEGKISYEGPIAALLLGGYKLAMMLLGLNVDMFAPSSYNVVVFLLYSTWWGVDLILTYIGPILFIYGSIKLLIQLSGRFHDLIGRAAGLVVGDLSRLSTIRAHRDLRRVASSTFIVAIAVSYSLSIVGSAASSEEFMARTIRMTVGADASIWLFSLRGAPELAGRIEKLDGVLGSSVEAWFEADSALGMIPVRAIEPDRWGRVAYIEEGWIEGVDPLGRMNSSQTSAMLERGAAELLGIKLNDTMLIKLGTRVHTLTIVGIFGKRTPMGWNVQNPTLYVPLSFMDRVEEGDIKQVRILVRLKEGVEPDAFINSVRAMDPNVSGVDIAELRLREASSNIFLVGSRRIEEMGVYIASLISSLGVALVVSTGLRSRWKEIVVMAIRGFSGRQLASILMVEYLSSTLLALILGSAVGYILLRGEIEMFNSLSQSTIGRRMVFPPGAQLTLSVATGLILISVVVPILFAARRASLRPIWTMEE